MTNPEFEVKRIEEIVDVKVIQYEDHSDKRGNIYSTYRKEPLLSLGLNFDHDKFSYSIKNVLRGFHADRKSKKIVTCVYGKVLQVLCDYRESSRTYLNTYSTILRHTDFKSLFVPVGVLNAYYVMSDFAIYHYKYEYDGDYADVQDQITVAWDDSVIGFAWLTNNPILSDRDLT